MLTWSQPVGMPSVLGQERFRALGMFTGKPCSHSPQAFSSCCFPPSRVLHVELQHVNSLSGAQEDVIPIPKCGDLRWAVRQSFYRTFVLLVGYSVLLHWLSLHALSPALCVLLWVSLCHCPASKGCRKCFSGINFWQLCIVAEEPCSFSLTLHGEYCKEKK